MWSHVLVVVLEPYVPHSIVRPAAPDARGPAGTAEPAAPVAPLVGGPPLAIFPIGPPPDLSAQGHPTQVSSNAWITEIQSYLKDNILPQQDEGIERIVRLAKRYTFVEGDLYRCGANNILMRLHNMGGRL
jgi:hypothetical protein